MIDVKFTGLDQATIKFKGLPQEISDAIFAKVFYLTDVLYAEVIENLSGRVLQKKTGDLSEHIEKDVERRGDTVIGRVFPNPITPKAIVQEIGGEGNYPIVPVKAQVLRFYWDKLGRVVNLKSVNHPPLKARRYLASALDYSDMANQMREALLEAVGGAIDFR